MRTRLSLVGIAGALAGAGAFALAAHQPAGRPTAPGPALTLLVGVSLIGCGLASWQARPGNRSGPTMIFTGFAWFAGLLIDASPAWLNTIGLALESAWIVGLVGLLLSYPSGALSGRLDRWLVAVTMLITVGFQLIAMLFGSPAGLRCSGCSGNLLQVVHDNHEALGWLNLQRVSGTALVLVLIGLLARRWLRSGAAQRRAVGPVLAAGAATLAALGATIFLDLLGDPLGSIPADVYFALTATVPIAVLLGFLQRRLARGMVAGLVVELSASSASLNLRDSISRALGDPSLQLAFWFSPERRYVQADGTPVVLPVAEDARGATFVEREGQPIAVLIHDPVIEDNAELIASVCAAASLSLENERLQAELRARLVELRSSRARLVQATDAERRRIERDLHDGTQQRLVSIAMSLGLLEARLDQPEAAAPLVRETREALAVALAELRSVTHGINPPLLAERGLPDALDELCRRAVLPVRLEVHVDTRLASELETAAYFMVSELLTNAAKHSHAGQVQVFASHRGGRLTVEVGDDGIGGAGLAGGSGLRGLTDRIEALGGRFTVSSPPGQGTLARAEIPCA